MTEIPEHLLRRSKERRAALSGEEGTGEATAEAAATLAETPSAATPVPAGTAPTTQASGGGGAAPVAPAPAPVAAEPAAPRPGRTRAPIPVFIIVMLVGLPLWGIIYLGAFGSRAKANANDPVTLGGTVFQSNCASCHGSNGEGGVGPQLNGGEVLKVWPKTADHVKWVQTGGAPYVGKTIGATNIPVPANNVMPAFATTLSSDQINDVVCYERVAFGNAPENATNCVGFTGP